MTDCLNPHDVLELYNILNEVAIVLTAFPQWNLAVFTALKIQSVSSAMKETAHSKFVPSGCWTGLWYFSLTSRV